MREEILFRNPGELLVHPLNAFYFDPLNEDERMKLKKSIIEDGVLEAALVTQDDIIVSGSNRRNICLEIGIMIPTRKKIYEGENREDTVLKHLILSNVLKRGGNDLGDSPIKQMRRLMTLEKVFGVMPRGGDRRSERNQTDSPSEKDSYAIEGEEDIASDPAESPAQEATEKYGDVNKEKFQIKLPTGDFDYKEDMLPEYVNRVEQEIDSANAAESIKAALVELGIEPMEDSDINQAKSGQMALMRLMNISHSAYYRLKRMSQLDPELQEKVDNRLLSVRAADFFLKLPPEVRQEMHTLFAANEAWTLCRIRENADAIAKEKDEEKRRLEIEFDAERQQSAAKLEKAVQTAHDMEESKLRQKRDSDDWRGQVKGLERQLEQEKADKSRVTREFAEHRDKSNRTVNAALKMSDQNSAYSAMLEEELEALRRAPATNLAMYGGELFEHNDVTAMDYKLQMLLRHVVNHKCVAPNIPREHLCSLHKTVTASVEKLTSLIKHIEHVAARI